MTCRPTAYSISPELDFIDRDYAAARAAGMPMITRFVYAQNAGDADAPASQILQQMKELAPVLSKNEDVIGVMDMGFVGAWGSSGIAVQTIH